MTDAPSHVHTPGILSKKYLGVPVVYYAGAFVGILLIVAWKLKSVDDTAAAGDSIDGADATTGDAATAASGDALGSGFVANPTPVYDTSTPAATTTVATNDSWLAAGIVWAAANGVASVDSATVALQAYLSGAQLSTSQGAIRDAVIKQYGLPPELPVSGGTAVAPAAAAKRQGTPPTYHTVQGTSDDSYGELAQLYYGSQAGDRIDLLQVANQSLGHAGPWPKGTKVFIPKYTAPVYYTATKSVQTLHEFAVKAGIPSAAVQELNDNVKFPVKVGTRVRIH